MDNHLQYVLVDHNLRKLAEGRLGRNVPNAYKRCIGSADTNVKGVQEPSCDSGDTGKTGNSLSSDLYCGKESTGRLEWQEVLGISWVRSEWETR